MGWSTCISKTPVDLCVTVICFVWACGSLWPLHTQTNRAYEKKLRSMADGLEKFPFGSHLSNIKFADRMKFNGCGAPLNVERALCMGIWMKLIKIRRPVKLKNLSNKLSAIKIGQQIITLWNVFSVWQRGFIVRRTKKIKSNCYYPSVVIPTA